MSRGSKANFLVALLLKEPLPRSKMLKKGHRINTHPRHRGHERAHCTQDGSVVGGFQLITQSHETRGMKDTSSTDFFCRAKILQWNAVYIWLGYCKPGAPDSQHGPFRSSYSIPFPVLYSTKPYLTSHHNMDT